MSARKPLLHMPLHAWVRCCGTKGRLDGQITNASVHLLKFVSMPTDTTPAQMPIAWVAWRRLANSTH